MDTTEIRTDDSPREGVAAYEAPTIIDAGGFAEETRGWLGDWPDNDSGLWL